MKHRARWIVTGGIVAMLSLWLIAPRTHYEPGPLLGGHAQLGSDCAACHLAWHGPRSDGCISCHGDIDNNPHGGVDTRDVDTGLLPGRRLAAVTALHNPTCLACHSEHQGRAVDVRVTAAFACTWCHKHPAIAKVPEHAAAPMKRQFFVRHLFNQPFNHYEHKLLITSHYPPVAGGFVCTSCHSVEPVKRDSTERMSFKWSGCAGVGCHLAPQDSYMRMPAAIGGSPRLIAYSGVFPMRHIKADFQHTAGHLRAACEQCHSQVAASHNPADAASLVIERCFNCHAHDPAAAAGLAANGSVRGIFDGAALAAIDQAPPQVKVVACADCHLFHSYGVVPLTDFIGSPPQFPPHQRKTIVLTVYVPHLRPSAGEAAFAGIGLRPVALSPWWLGLLAMAVVAASMAAYIARMPAAAAPQEAVAGVAPQRAREVPALDDTFQTSVHHLYIIGEAAGTASINLAMRSGRQVIEAIANELKRGRAPVRPEVYDVVVVGCGPAGLGATATAKSMGLKYANLEKMTPASTLRSYPRAKFVQATPIDIAEYGSFFLEGDNSREQLIKEWDRIIGSLRLVINEREEVVDIKRDGELLVVTTARGNVYHALHVVLAIGVRGNPRHLNLSGEDPNRVFYTLIEPDEFRGRKILVVGGGNAGAEVVQALAAPQLNNIVSYSFRSPVLTNVTRDNAERISDLQKSRRIALYPSTALKEIRPQSVVLDAVKINPNVPAAQRVEATGPIELENDVVFAMIGAELPTYFLKSIGVKMVSKGRWQV